MFVFTPVVHCLLHLALGHCIDEEWIVRFQAHVILTAEQCEEHFEFPWLPEQADVIVFTGDPGESICSVV